MVVRQPLKAASISLLFHWQSCQFLIKRGFIAPNIFKECRYALLSLLLDSSCSCGELFLKIDEIVVELVLKKKYSGCTLKETLNPEYQANKSLRNHMCTFLSMAVSRASTTSASRCCISNIIICVVRADWRWQEKLKSNGGSRKRKKRKHIKSNVSAGPTAHRRFLHPDRSDSTDSVKCKQQNARRRNQATRRPWIQDTSMRSIR